MGAMNLVCEKKWNYLQTKTCKQLNTHLMQKLLILLVVVLMALMVKAQNNIPDKLSKSAAFLGMAKNLSFVCLDLSKNADALLSADSLLTIHQMVVKKAAIGDLIGEYTVHISTNGTQPLTVFKLPTYPGHKYQLEVSCNGIMDKGKGSIEGKKRRGFLVDEEWTVIPGSLAVTEYTEYLGGGLSSADYTITHHKSDILVQAVGEPDVTINYEFKIKVYSVWANL